MKITKKKLTLRAVCALASGAVLARGVSYEAPKRWEDSIAPDIKPRVTKRSRTEAMLACARSDARPAALSYVMRDAVNGCEVVIRNNILVVAKDSTICTTTYYRRASRSEIHARKLSCPTVPAKEARISRRNAACFATHVGRFPDYKQVLPDASMYLCSSETLSVVSLISVCSKLELIRKKLRLSHATKRLNLVEETVAFNAEALLRLLRTFHANDVGEVVIECYRAFENYAMCKVIALGADKSRSDKVLAVIPARLEA
jgi:hypothetical protein